MWHRYRLHKKKEVGGRETREEGGSRHRQWWWTTGWEGGAMVDVLLKRTDHRKSGPIETEVESEKARNAPKASQGQTRGKMVKESVYDVHARGQVGDGHGKTV